MVVSHKGTDGWMYACHMIGKAKKNTRTGSKFCSTQNFFRHPEFVHLSTLRNSRGPTDHLPNCLVCQSSTGSTCWESSVCSWFSETELAQLPAEAPMQTFTCAFYQRISYLVQRCLVDMQLNSTMFLVSLASCSTDGCSDLQVHAQYVAVWLLQVHDDKANAGHHHLHSASLCQLSVPHTRTLYGNKSFAVHGQS